MVSWDSTEDFAIPHPSHSDHYNIATSWSSTFEVHRLLSMATPNALCIIPITSSTILVGHRLYGTLQSRSFLFVPSQPFLEWLVMVLHLLRMVLILLVSEILVRWCRSSLVSVRLWRRYSLWNSCPIRVSTRSWDKWHFIVVVTSIGRGIVRHGLLTISKWVKYLIFFRLVCLLCLVVLQMSSPLVIVLYQLLLGFLCERPSLGYRLFRSRCVCRCLSITCLRSQAQKGPQSPLRLAILTSTLLVLKVRATGILLTWMIVQISGHFASIPVHYDQQWEVCSTASVSLPKWVGNIIILAVGSVSALFDRTAVGTQAGALEVTLPTQTTGSWCWRDKL